MTEPTSSYEGRLIARPDDRVTLSQALLLGLQHVMAMDVYVVPFIIASALALSQADAASMIQSTFLAAGLGTLIQTAWCMRMPVAQGPSYIPWVPSWPWPLARAAASAAWERSMAR